MGIIKKKRKEKTTNSTRDVNNWTLLLIFDIYIEGSTWSVNAMVQTCNPSYLGAEISRIVL
jgi:hypothetical protein